jgi:hypothetical protein
MVRSEAVAVDDTGRPVDLTIRSFGILRAQDTPAIRIEIADADRGGKPLAVSDAVFAAALAAAWRSTGFAPRWPTHRAGRSTVADGRGGDRSPVTRPGGYVRVR